MIELIKFLGFAAVLIGLMKLIVYFCGIAATRFDVSKKFLTNVVMFIIFIICSLLWSFTGVYEWLSDVTGIPMEVSVLLTDLVCNRYQKISQPGPCF